MMNIRTSFHFKHLIGFIITLRSSPIWIKIRFNKLDIPWINAHLNASITSQPKMNILHKLIIPGPRKVVLGTRYILPEVAISAQFNVIRKKFSIILNARIPLPAPICCFQTSIFTYNSLADIYCLIMLFQSYNLISLTTSIFAEFQQRNIYYRIISPECHYIVFIRSIDVIIFITVLDFSVIFSDIAVIISIN